MNLRVGFKLVLLPLALVVVACSAGPSRAALSSAIADHLTRSYARIGRTVSDIRGEKTAAIEWDSFGEPNLWCVRASYTVSGARSWNNFRVVGRVSGPFAV